MVEGTQKQNSFLKTPENTELYETAIVTIWVDEYGIVCSASKQVRRTVEHYKEVMEIFAKLMKNSNKLCLLADVTDTMPMRSEVRDFIVAEMPKYIKAHAIVSEIPIQRTIATLFEKLSTSNYIMNQFTNEIEAKVWLKLFF
jgi:hypothetical protein